MKPLVSVCLITYNQERYIEETLKSIINQTYENIELIVSDDHSTDSTFEIILRYEKRLKERFERVVINQQKSNCGIVINCNSALNEVKGEYIKPFAGDDMMFEDCIEHLVDLMGAEIGIVHGNGYFIDDSLTMEDVKENEMLLEPLHRYSVDFSDDGYFERLIKGWFIIAPSTMIRKEVFDKIGLYDKDMYFEDYEFWLRAARAGVKFYYSNKRIVCYRRSVCSVSNMKFDSIARFRVFYREGKKAICKSTVECDDETRRRYQAYFVSNMIEFARSQGLKGPANQLVKNMKKNGLDKYIRNFR